MTLRLLRKSSDGPYGETVVAAMRLGSVGSIDATSIGTTTLYTVPAGATIVITGVELRCTAASGVTVPAKAGIGVAAGEDDIFSSQTLYGLLTAGSKFMFPVGGACVIATAGQAIKLGIDTGATGASQTITADIFGYEP